jgi:glucose-6-phosphate 1-epimerase
MTFATVAGAGNLPKVILTAADGARAEVYLHGAHVTSWLPAGASEDRLFLSRRSRFAAGAAIRGGIPVCFPQFATQGPLPSHGFARVTAWDLVRADVLDDGSARAVLRLTAPPRPGSSGRMPSPSDSRSGCLPAPSRSG